MEMRESYLGEQDRAVVQELRFVGALQNVDPHRVDLSEGCILCCCGDGHRVEDLFSFHSKLVHNWQDCPMLHSFMMNGGALLLSKDSPLPHAKLAGPALFNMILDTVRKIKRGVKVVALYLHGPCGGAREAGLNLIQCIDLALQAKKELRESPEFQALETELEFRVFFHADRGPDNKRTYFVSRGEYESWRTNHAVDWVPAPDSPLYIPRNSIVPNVYADGK